MQQYTIRPIGFVDSGTERTLIRLDRQFIPALHHLDGFSHVNILWWFSHFSNEASRKTLRVSPPYRAFRKDMGVFATRSPMRPNPLALTAAALLGIDHEEGVVEIGYIDAEDGTPVIDIKPYTPSLDRIENPGVPEWCAHWPQSLEESGCFDWESELRE